MILIEEAFKILKNFVKENDLEKVEILNSAGRILGEDIYSEIEMPPFDKSAMDGYAINSSDRSKKFKILETVPAGSFPGFKLKNKGECTKIMTGAPLPEGADRVIKVEVTGERGGFMYLKGEDRGWNVCIRGEDMKVGDIVLRKGRLIAPQHVGIMASVGRKDVNVYKKVSVSVLSSGSEIVEPGIPLKDGHIYNSNLYSVSSQVIDSGFELKGRVSVRDDLLNIRKNISSLLSESDVLLITGGVSMGEFDYVPEILKDIGFDVRFHKVAIKPGKPTLFASGMNKWIFGLPGNPVSTFVVFEVIVKPFLYLLEGHEYKPVIMKGVLTKEFTRKKNDRDLFSPVKYNQDGTIDLLEYHGSAHLRSLENANGLLKISKGVSRIPSGSEVYVRQV